MKAEDIKDPYSLENWLTGRPQQDAVAIASRSAARVGPLIWGAAVKSRGSDLTEMPFLRATFISGVAVNMPTPEIKNAATSADFSASAAGAATSSTDASSADFSASGAASSAASSAAAAATDAVAAAAGAATSAAQTGYFALVSTEAQAIEAGVNLTEVAIWDEVPPKIARAWADVQEIWRNEDPNWQFWIDWYQALLEGRPQNIDMLTEIALIPPEDWDKGAEHVNAVIAGIVDKYQLDRVIAENPYSLRVEYVASHQKLVAHSIDVVDSKQVDAVARQAMKDFTRTCRNDTSGNAPFQILAAACEDAIRDLRRDLKRYSDSVVALYDSLILTQKAIHQAAAANGMDRAAPLIRLTEVLDNCAKDLAGSAPALLETLKRRSSVDLARLRQEQIATMAKFCLGMKNDSEGYLELACQFALTTMLDPKAAETDRQAAWMFMTAMVPRGARAILAAHQDGTAPKPPAGKASKFDKVVNAATSVDKLVDIGQEANTEFGPWVAGFLGSIP